MGGGRGEEEETEKDQVMASPDRPSLPPACPRDSAIHEMIRGQDMAGQLEVLLRRDLGEPTGWDGHLRARELTEGMLKCFSAALAALDSVDPCDFRRVPVGEASGQPGCHRWGADGGAGKSRIRPSGERRRGMTRRSQPYAWTKLTSKTQDDGYTWRKYGQKEIHGFKHPRCYFRCTYKYDQGCQATRQVQKSEEDPSMFQITYLGHHTCKKPTATLRPASGPAAGAQSVISFGPPVQYPLAPAPFPLPKQQPEEVAVSSSLSRNDDSSPECFMLPELTALQEMSAPAATGISSAASDVAGDVTSGGQPSPCVSPNNRVGVGFPGELYRFEDMFTLDQDEYGYEFLFAEPCTALKTFP